MTGLKKQLLLVYAGYFFRYVYLLVLIPYYGRVLGPEAYGLVLAAMSVYMVVWTVQNWGFSYVGSRNIATTAASPEGQQHEVARHLTARLLLTPISLTVGLVAIWNAPLLRDNLMVSGVALLCGLLSGFNLGWFFQGRMSFNTPVSIEIVGFASMLALVLTFVHAPPDNVLVMPFLLFSTVLTTSIAYRLASRLVKLSFASQQDGWALIRESAPLFISGGAGVLMTNVGTYSLATMSTADQVAYYGTAEKVITTGLALLAPAGQVLLTWFSKMVHESAVQTAVLKQQMRALRVVVLAGAFASLACFTFVPYALEMVMGARFAGASAILRMLAPVFVVAAFNQSVCSYFLVPRRLDRVVSLISVATAIMGSCMTAGGAWWGGAHGAAVGRVCAELTFSTLLIGYCWRQRKALFG